MCLANQLTIVRPAAKAAIIRPKANAKANAKSLARLRIPRIPKILVVLKRFGWTTANYLRAGDSGYRIAWWLHHQTQSCRAFLDGPVTSRTTQFGGRRRRVLSEYREHDARCVIGVRRSVSHRRTSARNAINQPGTMLRSIVVSDSTHNIKIRR